MNKKILVTGATGTIGKALVKSLQKHQASFIAGVRNIVAARNLLGDEAEIRHFDFSEPATFETATQDVDQVFVLGPPLVLNLDELLTPFLDFLKKKGITRVVYVAALGLEHVKELPFHTRIMDKLTRDGFNYTFLKPGFFAQNFKNYEWENITDRGIIYAVAGDGKAGFTDVEDIAEVAARVLTTEGHSHKTCELTGPEALSYQDAAAVLSEVLGKQIIYPNPSAEEYKATLQAAGAPGFIADYMISVYSMIAGHKVDIVTDTVKQITGKKATPLKEVLQRDFAKIATQTV